MEFPIGVSDFERLITGDYFFVDKSLLIKEIMENGTEVILLTRPRRFGKTLNLSMLAYFLSENYYNKTSKTLFDGLDISKNAEFCEKHQGQYPVIFISFKDVKKKTYADAYANIVALIQDLYGQHRYLLEGNLLEEDEKNTFQAFLNKQADKEDIESALKKLAGYITRKFQKLPILLIDEYDTPIQQAYYYDDMIGLMRGMLGQMLKDNKPGFKFLEKAIITGITRIAQESLFSGVNNLEVYSLLE